MAKRILITGISGFIGRRLAAALIKQGHQVFGLARTDATMEDVIIQKADVLDALAVEEACKDKEVVIHLSAVTAHQHIINNPYQALHVNLIGTYNVLSAVAKSEVQYFIYPSSGKVYGKPNYLPYDENHPVNPQTMLGKMKHFAESLIDFFASGSNKTFTILRIFNVYGAGQKSEFLIPTILRQIDGSVIWLGNIDDKRDYLYLDDLIDAFNLIIDSSLSGLSIMNVGSGISHSAREIVELLGCLVGKELIIKADASKFRKDEICEERANIERIRALGWSPKHDLELGLRETLQVFYATARGV